MTWRSWGFPIPLSGNVPRACSWISTTSISLISIWISVWELVTFLDRCRFPSTAPKIALFDLNPHSLAKSAKRLRRYNPSCYRGNALQRIDIGMSGFYSISLNYLLHCLPGNLASKSIVFENVKPLLRDGGVIFGSTILGEGVRHNPLAKQLMRIYNAKGIFSNLSVRQSDLEAGLKAHFDEHTIHIAGSVALFSARKGFGESRYLQHQQHQQAARQPLGLVSES